MVPAIPMHTIPDISSLKLRWSILSRAIVQEVFSIENSLGCVMGRIAHHQSMNSLRFSAMFSEFRIELLVLATCGHKTSISYGINTTNMRDSEKSTFFDDHIHLQSTVKSRVVNDMLQYPGS